MKPKKSKSLDGFSIVEVLIAGSLIIGLFFGLSQLLTNAMKGQKTVQNAVDFDILKTSLNLVFNSKACDSSLYSGGSPYTFIFPTTLNLGDPLPKPLPVIDEIKHGTSSIALRNSLIGGGMTLSTLEIAEATYDGDQTIAGVDYKAFATVIKIGVTKSEGSMGGPLQPKLMSVRLLARASGTNAGRVEKCGGTTQSSRVLTCTNAQSTSTDPTAIPACVAAAANGGGGTLSGPINAAPINCRCAGPYGPGRFATYVAWNGTAWTSMGTTACTCVDGTMTVATW